MIEDMSVRGFSEKTRNDYIRHVRAFAAFIGHSPDTATAEDLRRFQLYQTQSGMQPPSVNSAVSALHFFFTVTLDRPDLARRLTVVRQPRRLPAVLSVEEVTLLLQAAPGAKYKAALATAYGAGLRVSEGRRPAQPSLRSLPGQIPKDGTPPATRPRVLSSEAFGRRPHHRWIGHDRPASETLHVSGHPSDFRWDNSIRSYALANLPRPNRICPHC